MGRSRTGYGSNRGALNPVQITKYIKKTAAQTRYNSTTFVNDTDLRIIFPNRASVYDIELVAFVTGPDSANFKSTWVLSGGCSQITYRSCYGPASSDADATYNTDVNAIGSSLTSIQTYGTDGAYVSSIREKFIVATTSAKSMLQWQWGQNVAYGDNTTVYQHSYILVTEIRLMS